MYPSGTWDGFWQQDGYGRQPMRAFTLRFAPSGEVTGGGADVIGPFTVAGECDPATGAVALLKTYLGRHTVEYIGSPDGEGSIGGEWTVDEEYFGSRFVNRGPFLLRPVLPEPSADDPVQEIVF